MRCKDALLLMDKVIDGRSTPFEEQMLHFHTSGCRACKRTMMMNRDISRVFREISRPEPPADLEERVRASLAASTATGSRRRPTLRYAVALPFVAALLIALGLSLGGGTHMQETLVAAVDKAEDAGGSWKRPVTTPPLTAYIRPTGLVTF